MSSLLSKLFTGLTRGSGDSNIDGTPHSMRLLAHQSAVIGAQANRNSSSVGNLLQELTLATRAVTSKAVDRFTSVGDLEQNADIGIRIIPDGARVSFLNGPDEAILSVGSALSLSSLEAGLASLKKVSDPSVPPFMSTAQNALPARWENEIKFRSPSGARVINLAVTVENAGISSKPTPTLRLTQCGFGSSKSEQFFSLPLNGPVRDIAISTDARKIALLEELDSDNPSIKMIDVLEEAQGISAELAVDGRSALGAERIVFLPHSKDLIALNHDSINLLIVSDRFVNSVKLEKNIPEHIGDRDSMARLMVNDLGDRVVVVLPCVRKEEESLQVFGYDLYSTPGSHPRLICCAKRKIADSINAIRWLTLSPNGTQLATVGVSRNLKVVDLNQKDSRNDASLQLPFREMSGVQLLRSDLTVSFLAGGRMLGVGLTRYLDPQESIIQSGALILIDGEAK